MDLQWVTLAGILGVSFMNGLTGVGHCAFMCGPFVATVNLQSEGSHKLKSNFLYNFGRLAGYSLIGLILGSLGSVMNHIGDLVWIHRLSAVASGLFLVILGIQFIRTKEFPEPGKWFTGIRKLITPGIRSAGEKKQTTVLALLLGLSSALLPCGLLYPAFAFSFALANPLLGALSMSVFFAGTLPGLLLLGLGMNRLSPLFQPRKLAWLGYFLVLFGISVTLLRLSHTPGHNHTGVLDKLMCDF